MYLNTLKPAPGAKTPAKRVGRGIGCGKGKTCGRGHKGQSARAGGFHKLGFEGGQMPLQRRIPKSGFRSRKAIFATELRLSDLNKVEAEVITLEILKEHGLISRVIKTVKIIASGELTKEISLKGILATKGAAKAIKKVGGKIHTN